MNDDSSNSKKAPTGRPFPPNVSGNPKGRPKGSLNEADLLNDLFNRKIGGKSGKQRVTVIRAVIQQQFTKAMQGDKPASKLIFDFRDKLGLAHDVTSEERKKRTLNLGRALTRDEYDFKIAESREKERQYCAAIVDRENPTSRNVPATILSGDEHLDNGRYEQALRDYAAQVSTSKKVLTERPEDKEAKRNLERAIARIGLLADRLVQKGDFDAAARYVATALIEDQVSDLTWIRLIGAHADMFRGKTEDAREFYCHFQSNKRVVVFSWESMILRNFAEFRKLGQLAPLMDEVEVRLMDAGWRTTLHHVDPATLHPAITDAEQKFVLHNPHHLETGAIYAKYKSLDEAAQVYRLLLAQQRSELAQKPNQTGASGTLALIEMRLGLLARDYLFAGRFRLAFECVNDLPPGRLSLQLTRAHALMLIEQTADAKDIYLRHRGQSVEGKSWESAILADFRTLTSKGFISPLMHTIKSQFDETIGTTWIQAASKSVGEKQHRSMPTQMPSVKVPDLSEKDDIPSAQQLMYERKFEAALTVYRRRIKWLVPKFANERLGTGQERIDRQACVDGLSEIAFDYLLKQEIKTALEIAEEALSFLSNAYWPALRRAHALMLLDRADEARPIYKMYLTEKATPERTQASVIRDEFAAMRAVNLAHPLMDEIEALLPPAPSLSRIIR